MMKPNGHPDSYRDQK